MLKDYLKNSGWEQTSAIRNEWTYNKVQKPTASERNAQELARVKRENRLSGSKDLVKGQTYSLNMGKNRTVKATYVRSEMVNGIATSVFKTANGKYYRLDNDDLKKSVSKG